jgi:hypothetical protein
MDISGIGGSKLDVPYRTVFLFLTWLFYNLLRINLRFASPNALSWIWYSLQNFGDFSFVNYDWRLSNVATSSRVLEFHPLTWLMSVAFVAEKDRVQSLRVVYVGSRASKEWTYKGGPHQETIWSNIKYRGNLFSICLRVRIIDCMSMFQFDIEPFKLKFNFQFLALTFNCRPIESRIFFRRLGAVDYCVLRFIQIHNYNYNFCHSHYAEKKS